MAHQSEKSVGGELHAWDIAAFSRRLRQAMGGQSAYSLERKTGIAQSLIRKYLSGSSSPGADKLVALASALQVPVGWLATGEPSMLDIAEASEPPDLGVKEAAIENVRQEGPAYQAGACPQAGTPTVVYARMMESLFEQTDSEEQREWVLQRAVDIICTACEGRTALMAGLSKTELERAVALAVAAYKISRG
ncbi:hypothetical protein L861_08670 [Litchfieldella anticariensis FP35 = DSM 16096]|uniref:HTH cro/C1-type domain-containing protein n=1 Tax=Litchfieldella anticariensis (strain DSM 16096 / CECT 5854 / CIP 108499 / LMG 22089 / FP35) TaxID=1121939 RepID=S2LCI0_LITA3|nr:helix-turn-helix domain-containing protein [Halomonas anticariensis]EPC02436.1 hypothetical protein L861_08670 [Halomonas anticariensis FP35 = DSM 16096]